MCLRVFAQALARVFVILTNTFLTDDWSSGRVASCRGVSRSVADVGARGGRRLLGAEGKSRGAYGVRTEGETDHRARGIAQ
jgi:hypothetical protein